MMQTLNKHVKWRKDNGFIFICDCKRLVDLKLSLKYEPFIKKLFKGIEKEKLDKEEKLVFSDFEKMKLLSQLEIRKIAKKDFPKAMDILDNELGKQRVRNTDFLYDKFKEYSEFFIGIYLNDEIIGIICGFPREDYLLISELAVDSRFHRRGFGKKLIEKFEQIAKKQGYKKINVGAQDNTIDFYSSLNYTPFLLIQFEKENYSLNDFNDFKIIKFNPGIAEIKIKNCNLTEIQKLRKKYPKAYLQYIFTKKI